MIIEEKWTVKQNQMMHQKLLMKWLELITKTEGIATKMLIGVIAILRIPIILRNVRHSTTPQSTTMITSMEEEERNES